MNNSFDPTEPTLTLEFKTVEQAKLFKYWMANGCGDQQFWNYCDDMNAPTFGWDFHADPNKIVAEEYEE